MWGNTKYLTFMLSMPEKENRKNAVQNFKKIIYISIYILKTSKVWQKK